MCKQTFIVIGLDDNRQQVFQPEVLAHIACNRIFSGGIRHYEIVKSYLPEEHVWIPVLTPLQQVFDAYTLYPSVVVFASGDPLFYGFAGTIRRRLPAAQVTVYPVFNSLQQLAHRLSLPYQEMHPVSLTGRPWDKLDEALITGQKMIGILTDRTHTPATIASRLLEYGYTNYRMAVGELLGNKELEKATELSLEEATRRDYQFPNNLLLLKTATRPRPFGIPDREFHLLHGRSKMITKKAIRMLDLSMLDLRDKQVFWDIGFCTGSVSIEAKLQFPHLAVYAFEKRPEGAELMELNTRKFGTPGIQYRIGDFMETDLSGIPNPEAVFIGGHGGQLKAIINRVVPLLPAGGTLLFNAVSSESKTLFTEAIRQQPVQVQETTRIQIDDFNPIEIIKAIKQQICNQ